MLRKFKPNQLIKDLRSGLDDTTLMAKYGFSTLELEATLRNLKDQGVLTDEDIEQRSSKTRKFLEVLSRDTGIRIFGGNFGSLGDLLNAAKKQNIFLGGADLRGASLSEARLPDIRLPRVDLRKADLSRACLAGADLSEADLSDATLWKADLRGADFTGAVLVATDFQGADLSGANFTGANLSGANLHKANLAHTDFTGADLTNTKLSDFHFHEYHSVSAPSPKITLKHIISSASPEHHAKSRKDNPWERIRQILTKPVGFLGIQLWFLVVQTLLLFGVSDYLVHFAIAVALVNGVLWYACSPIWSVGILLQGLYPFLWWKLSG